MRSPTRRQLHIEYVRLSTLKTLPGNPRRNEVAVPKVAASIDRFGWTNPILASRATRTLVAGHTRLEAAKRLGIEKVPVVWLDLGKTDARLYALADNKLAELAEWDDEALAAILRELREEDAPLSVAGFDDSEIDELLAKVEAERLAEVEEAEDAVIDPPKKPKSRRGDLYELGPHRLLCGDSTKAEDVLRAMGGHKADLLWTDPPYNVGYVGKTKDALTIQNDSMDDPQFRAFLVSAFAAADAAMRPGAVFYIAHADSEGFNFRAAVRDTGWKQAQTLIWVKDRFVLGRQDYQWRHEPILYGWKDGAAHLALKDRTQDTVWPIARPTASRDHPTTKPLELVQRAIRNSSRPRGAVLDLFGGSGTTLIAAEKEQRVAYLLELDPGYCDVIRRRWELFQEVARSRE